jgi:tRNA G37 N-methylase TrmD
MRAETAMALIRYMTRSVKVTGESFRCFFLKQSMDQRISQVRRVVLACGRYGSLWKRLGMMCLQCISSGIGFRLRGGDDCFRFVAVRATRRLHPRVGRSADDRLADTVPVQSGAPQPKVGHFTSLLSSLLDIPYTSTLWTPTMYSL